MEALRDTGRWAYTQASAQSLAGHAVLLEIGAQLGVLDPLLTQGHLAVGAAAASAGLSDDVVAAWCEALVHAGLATPGAGARPGTAYDAGPHLHGTLNSVGYLLWGLNSCLPLIANARAFGRSLPAAAATHRRDGEHVARTSRWMGERDFYPHAERAILGGRPRKIVDLGAGTCGLLMRCLRQLPEAHGIGIDINPQACARARVQVRAAGLADRLTVIEAPIESLVDDPAPIAGAEVIHGGFVFHDLLPEQEATLDALLRTFRRNAPQAALLVVDAVPYASGSERAFSAAFTFLHSHFMGRRLLGEAEWTAKLSAAGYGTVSVERLGISGGRIFTARSE